MYEWNKWMDRANRCLSYVFHNIIFSFLSFFFLVLFFFNFVSLLCVCVRVCKPLRRICVVGEKEEARKIKKKLKMCLYTHKKVSRVIMTEEWTMLVLYTFYSVKHFHLLSITSMDYNSLEPFFLRFLHYSRSFCLSLAL